MTLQDLMAALQANWNNNLKSIVRYGAAAIDDQSTEPSDQFLLILLSNSCPASLAPAADTIRKWVKHHHPMPFIFDEAAFRQSADIFPIDYLSMQDHHEVMFGINPLQNIRIDQRHLRLQCESEMQGRLIHLKSEFVLKCHEPKQLLQLMLQSLADFDRIFCGIMHLLGEKPVTGRRKTLDRLAIRIGFNPDVFIQLYDSPKHSQATQKFEHYLTALEAITKYVDTHSIEGGS